MSCWSGKLVVRTSTYQGKYFDQSEQRIGRTGFAHYTSCAFYGDTNVYKHDGIGFFLNKNARHVIFMIKARQCIRDEVHAFRAGFHVPNLTNLFIRQQLNILDFFI